MLSLHLLAVVFVFSLTAIAGKASTPSCPQIEWVDCSKHVPHTDIPLNLTGIDLSALPSTLHCGRFAVPMDYAKPISATNNITLGLAMYRPKNPKGVIFYNPGGTDAAAVWAWKAALNQTTSSTPNFNSLLEYDLMMADTRGTFSSNELNVSIDTVLPLVSSYPTNETQYDAFRAASAAVFKSFAASSTPSGILEFVGTREFVQDQESIRKALGYETIHFLGCSTGSYRAAQYASQYPQRVGRFILDAVSPHGMTIFTQSQYDIKAVNRGLLRADAYCVANASCPFHNQGKGSVVKAWLEILAAAKNTSYSETFSVQAGLLDLLSGQPDFPVLFETFDDILKVKSLGSSRSSPGLGAVIGIPIICADTRIQDNTWSGWQDDVAALKQFDTYHIEQSLTLQFRLYCAAWPYLTPPIEPLNLQTPILLVTADFDVNTPTEKATFQWQQAPHSVLMVRHGDDHVSFNEPDLTTTTIMKDFLTTGILPTSRQNSKVSIYRHPALRDPISDPYEVPTGFIAGDIDSAE